MSNPKGIGGFQKGQSGNPSGRPKKDREVERLARQALEGGKLGNIAFEALRDIILASEKDSDRIKASELVMAYAYGKPRQQVDIDTPEDSPFARMVFYLPDNGRGGEGNS